MPKMTDDQLRSIVDNEIRAAVGTWSTKISEDRAKALDYYYGRPFGNEVEGQSQVVSTDVADTIEWVLPSLLKIFTSGDRVVTFEPQGAEDVEASEQATDYVNYVWNRDNPGFMNFHTWFKDSLLSKNAAVKIWWEVSPKIVRQTLRGLTDEQLAVLAQDDDIEIVAHTATQGEPGVDQMGQHIPPVALHDVTIAREEQRGCIKVDCVPPEEFLIDRQAKSIADARYVGHRVRRTISQLREEGYPAALLERLGGDAGDSYVDEEKLSRREDEDQSFPGDTDSTDPSQRYVWVVESYVDVDYDGDGIAERRKVTTAGGGSVTVLLDNVEWPTLRPFASITPVPMPHKFYGRSYADVLMDLQLIKSTLWRQMLNNLYLTNNPMKEVVEDNVINLDEVLTSRAGGLIRVKSPNSVREIATPFVAQQAFPMLEYLDGVRENRTGITKYNQGLDANSLNKTATGISQIMNAAQQRIELVARIFAETGVADAFKIILELATRYQDRERMIRLRGKWVAMDPRTWNTDMDMTVTVGLGTGNKDQMLGHLMQIMGIQTQAVQFQGGLEGPLVNAKGLYHTAEKIVENAGLKQAELFFMDPTAESQQPQQPKPNPAMEKAQAEIETMRAKAQAEMQLKQMSAQADIEIEKMKAQAQVEIERMKAEAQAALKASELHAKAMSGAFAPQPQAAVVTV
jgi:hypothetical protein